MILVVVKTAMQAHLLKYKYGMNPLCITWPYCILTTEENFEILSILRVYELFNQMVR